MKKKLLVQLIAFSGLILASLVTNAEPFVWVANQTTKDITVIDAATNTVVDTIFVNLPAPRSLAFTPDGAFAYVAQSTGGAINAFNRVKVFDAATKSLVTTITVFNPPEDIAITPDGRFAYVSILFSSNIFVIDTATNTFISFPLGARGFGIAFTPDSAFAYIANGGSNTVSVVDTVTHTVVDTIPVGSTPKSVAITPDGAFVYVGNASSNDVSVINTATKSVVATVAVGNRPETRGLAITPNGKFVYVGSSGGNSIFVIDTATNSVTTIIGGVNPPGGTGVLALAITPDGDSVYAANFASASLTEGPVSVVSIATNTLVTTIDGGDRPQAVAITPITTLDVAIDIKPGSDPNSINLGSAGVVPVAILSTVDFDAPAEVDPDTIGLAGARVKMVGRGNKFLCHSEDVNGDALADLVCQLETAQFMIEIGDSVAVLEAETFGGISVRGEDTINIIP